MQSEHGPNCYLSRVKMGAFLAPLELDCKVCKMKRRLIKIEEETAKAETPVSLYFDSHSSGDPAAIVSYILRNRYGRADLSRALTSNVQSKEFSVKLEEARSAISQGHLQAAATILNQLEPTEKGDEAEILLEKVRVLRAQNQLEESLQKLEEIATLPECAPITRMTAYQMLGDVLLSLNQPLRALENLELGGCLAKLYPLAQSASAIRAYQIVAYVRLEDEMAARRSQESFYAFLNSIERDGLWLRHLLFAIRSETYITRKWGTIEQTRGLLEEAKCISRWLGDKATLAKCDDDVANLQLNTNSVDVLKFQNWSFLARRGVVLVDEPSRIVEIIPNSLTGRFLSVLATAPSMSVSELFEKVWGLNFDKARHNNILRVTITNLRKQILSSAIKVHNGDVSLQ